MVRTPKTTIHSAADNARGYNIRFNTNMVLLHPITASCILSPKSYQHKYNMKMEYRATILIDNILYKSRIGR